jgi:hypothetical protein
VDQEVTNFVYKFKKQFVSTRRYGGGNEAAIDGQAHKAGLRWLVLSI